jgi:hypothetical protein
MLPLAGFLQGIHGGIVRNRIQLAIPDLHGIPQQLKRLKPLCPLGATADARGEAHDVVKIVIRGRKELQGHDPPGQDAHGGLMNVGITFEYSIISIIKTLSYTIGISITWNNMEYHGITWNNME